MVADDLPPHPRRRQIRLSSRSYAQLGAICSVTVAVHQRRPVFAKAEIAAAVIDVLRSHAAETGVLVYAYCVMPDHVHIVVSPAPACDIIAFVGQFKNLAQRAAWRWGVTGSFWQKSFWDHFVRSEDDLGRIVEYLLNNPVRRGLADRWQDYPFTGSVLWGR